jgi:SAM-dependent methyltransferase
MEWVTAGGVLQRCRTAFLAETANSHRALLLGEGPGRFLVELLRTNPRVEVTCVERSPRMIEEAQKRLNESELARVQFVQADALQWQVGRVTPCAPQALSHLPNGAHGVTRPTARLALPQHEGFDLIVTHFFLDCFRREELAELVAKIATSATADARWLLADFREPESGWRRWRGRAALALIYGFFRVATGLSASRLSPPDGFLETGGFRLASRRLANFGLIHSDLWARTAA